MPSLTPPDTALVPVCPTCLTQWPSSFSLTLLRLSVICSGQSGTPKGQVAKREATLKDYSALKIMTLGNCFFTKWLLCVSFFDPDILIQSLHNCRIHNSTLASKQTSTVSFFLFVCFSSAIFLFSRLCFFPHVLFFLPRSRIFLNCIQDISRYQLLCIKQRGAVRHIWGFRACYQQH